MGFRCRMWPHLSPVTDCFKKTLGAAILSVEILQAAQ